MINDYARHFEELYSKGEQDGIELGILKTKVHIVTWLLDKGVYKNANDIAIYILSLKTEDIINEPPMAADIDTMSSPPVDTNIVNDTNKGENTYSEPENEVLRSYESYKLEI